MEEGVSNEGFLLRFRGSAFSDQQGQLDPITRPRPKPGGGAGHSSGGSEQLAGVARGSLVGALAAQHAADLLDHTLAVQPLHGGK